MIRLRLQRLFPSNLIHSFRRALFEEYCIGTSSAEHRENKTLSYPVPGHATGIPLKIEIRINPQFIYPRDPGSPNLRMASWNLKNTFQVFVSVMGYTPTAPHLDGRGEPGFVEI